eukprot:TRINITY_DN19587_c0_g1_i2.p3 TRINITY_DN19587_c0_g1~~TRINITY_DN19587_c0_g1_i2.p3  ORF type:complete len:146 (+),score=19.14 TRINITY_DN19587_c0_g1_i2:75-512(+)
MIAHFPVFAQAGRAAGGGARRRHHPGAWRQAGAGPARAGMVVVTGDGTATRWAAALVLLLVLEGVSLETNGVGLTSLAVAAAYIAVAVLRLLACREKQGGEDWYILAIVLLIAPLILVPVCRTSARFVIQEWDVLTSVSDDLRRR